MTVGVNYLLFGHKYPQNNFLKQLKFLIKINIAHIYYMNIIMKHQILYTV